MFDVKERQIRHTLRQLARQRVAMILQPGDVWVIEYAVRSDAETNPALLTCRLRGWIEPVENAIPHRPLAADGSLPSGPLFDEVAPIYRLTDSGWSVVNRAQLFVLASALIAAVTLIATVVPWLTMH